MNWLQKLMLKLALGKIRKVKGMSKILDWLKGKKTYITALLAGVCAVLVELGIDIPPIVWEILAILGITFLRAGVTKNGG